MGDSDKIIKRLEKEGWRQYSQTGSHRSFRHPDKALIITVPHPRKDLGTGLKRKIAKIAGW